MSMQVQQTLKSCLPPVHALSVELPLFLSSANSFCTHGSGSVNRSSEIGWLAPLAFTFQFQRFSVFTAVAMASRLGEADRRWLSAGFPVKKGRWLTSEQEEHWGFSKHYACDCDSTAAQKHLKEIRRGGRRWESFHGNMNSTGI
jgi:hypothetical protein